MNPDLLAAACTAVSLCGLLVWAASANPVCPDTPLGELAQLDDQSIACTHAAIQDLRYTTDGMRLTLSDANHTLAAQSDRYLDAEIGTTVSIRGTMRTTGDRRYLLIETMEPS
jgi:hypothetical protein